MTHITEHTLELYALGAEEIEAQSAEIEAHLLECEGCKRLVERMTAFYAEAENEILRNPQSIEHTQRALVRARTQVEPFYIDDSPALPLRPVTRLQHIQHFIRRHPAMTGGGTFAALAGLALLFNTTLTTLNRDKNPNFINYKTAESKIEILDKKYGVLWNIPYNDVSRLEADVTRGVRQQIAVFDLDGDGHNEIVSSIPLPEDGGQQGYPFRVLDANKAVKNQLSLNREIHYLGRTYAVVWNPGMFVVDSSNRSDPTIIVAWNGGRSPVVITRLNRKLEIVGEYWHFGGIWGMRLLDIDHDGKPELIISGKNEALDTVSGEFPAFAVLDPSKIVGVGKSKITTGFAMGESEAELLYIGLPVSPLAALFGQSEMVAGISNVGPKFFSCWVEGANDKKQAFSFEYVFSLDMRLQEVKSTNGTDFLYQQLAKEGKVSGKADAAYLENLKSRVRYWDGKEWRKEVVRVNNDLVASK